MSAPLKDPLVVNTQDNRCWVRRAWSQDGHGLYGLEGSPQDAEQTLFLLRELAEYGLRSMVDALPMPVGVPDALTRTFAPTQVLRDEDPFGLHHTYRVPRDLPEAGGASVACCHLHKVAGCCDPEDCGPCCEGCPTCPTLARQRAESGGAR